jgi:hypothetical protein
MAQNPTRRPQDGSEAAYVADQPPSTTTAASAQEPWVVLPPSTASGSVCESLHPFVQIRYSYAFTSCVCECDMHRLLPEPLCPAHPARPQAPSAATTCAAGRSRKRRTILPSTPPPHVSGHFGILCAHWSALPCCLALALAQQLRGWNMTQLGACIIAALLHSRGRAAACRGSGDAGPPPVAPPAAALFNDIDVSRNINRGWFSPSNDITWEGGARCVQLPAAVLTRLAAMRHWLAPTQQQRWRRRRQRRLEAALQTLLGRGPAPPPACPAVRGSNQLAQLAAPRWCTGALTGGPRSPPRNTPQGGLWLVRQGHPQGARGRACAAGVCRHGGPCRGGGALHGGRLARHSDGWVAGAMPLLPGLAAAASLAAPEACLLPRAAAEAPGAAVLRLPQPPQAAAPRAARTLPHAARHGCLATRPSTAASTAGCGCWSTPAPTPSCCGWARCPTPPPPAPSATLASAPPPAPGPAAAGS